MDNFNEAQDGLIVSVDEIENQDHQLKRQVNIKDRTEGNDKILSPVNEHSRINRHLSVATLAKYVREFVGDPRELVGTKPEQGVVKVKVERELPDFSKPEHLNHKDETHTFVDYFGVSNPKYCSHDQKKTQNNENYSFRLNFRPFIKG